MIGGDNPGKNKRHAVEMNHADAFMQKKIPQKTAEQRKGIIYHACLGGTQYNNGFIP